MLFINNYNTSFSKFIITSSEQTCAHTHTHTKIITQKILNFVFYFWGTVWERECKDWLLPGHSSGGTSFWSQPVLWQCGKSEPLAFHPGQRHLPSLGVPLTSVFSITDITMVAAFSSCNCCWPCCFTSTEVRLLIMEPGGGFERVKAWPQILPEKV